MKEYMPDQHPLIENLDIDTKFLLFLERSLAQSLGTFGVDKRWNGISPSCCASHITEERRDEYLETLNMMYLAYVEELLSDNAALTFEKHAYFIESKAHYQTLLKYKDDRERGIKVLYEKT